MWATLSRRRISACCASMACERASSAGMRGSFLPMTKRMGTSSSCSTWVREGREANTNFDYSVPLATTVLLGNVAARAGKKKLLWDGTRVTNDEAANAFLSTTYRDGWSLN